MRLFAALLPLLTLGATPPMAVESVPAKVISAAPNCRQQVSSTQSAQGPLVKPLDQLPPGQAYQAVYRLDANGCIDPLLVSDRIRQQR